MLETQKKSSPFPEPTYDVLSSVWHTALIQLLHFPVRQPSSSGDGRAPFPGGINIISFSLHATCTSTPGLMTVGSLSVLLTNSSYDLI